MDNTAKERYKNLIIELSDRLADDEDYDYNWEPRLKDLLKYLTDD
tara:strand:+ start:3724 stop:3858 length:135 start_codon:yes stop_codon:yes gene_type:complete